jgi:predicted TIM-barrel fold metal-dependent hydrolase
VQSQEKETILSTSPTLGSAEPETSRRIGGKLVDVHMHFLPECYREALAAAGMATLDGGIPIPQWSEDLALKTMDELGIESALLSISSPSIRFLDGQAELDLCRNVNLAGADLVARHPDRFGLMATLPLPETDAALAEIAFALDQLEADGVVIETNIRGIYLGDQRLAPMFDELDHRGAVVFLHPTSPACFEAVALGRPAPMTEFPLDTTRTVVDLLYSGTLLRCSDLKIIVPHGGGAVPALAQRIAGVAARPYLNPRPKDEEEVYRLLASLYYDVVQSGHAAPLSALRHIAPVDHLLFGSDWPFGKVETVKRNVRFVEDSDLSDQDLALIGRENAHRLFPRFRLACACKTHQLERQL